MLLATGVTGALADAQAGGERFLVSTTSDVQPIGSVPFVDDASLIAVGNTSPSPQFFEAQWLATTGFVPSDIDALARRPGRPVASAESLVFSLLSNEAGFEDGDVLALGPEGGVVVVVPERDLIAALGVPTASIDVDALAYDDQGELLFSLQNDIDGTVIGLLQDGDVLRLDAAGVLHIVMTEPEIEAKVAIATGSGSAIGDVQGIEWQGGELWVVPQSPSAVDGAVIAVGSTPRVVMDEAAAALGGAEIDALAFVRPGEELARIYLDTTTAAPGDVVRFDFLGEPNGVYLVLQSGGTGYHRFPMLNGFESLYFDPADPWLAAELVSLGDNIAIMSPVGSLIFDYTLPTAPVFGTGFGGESGWSFQMIDLRTLEVSAPARIRM